MNNLVLLDGNKISGGINYITPECYSTEEREVGCWINGKPLYQKTFKISNPDSTSGNIDISSLNIEEMISRRGSVYRNSSPIQQKEIGYRTESPSDANYGFVVELRGSNLVWDIYGYPSSQIEKMSITLQYTKTTDTAGSGVWTPSGIPAVHYSTDEQVIGTWIDGSTLYEKTIDCGYLPSSTIKSVSTGVNNIGLVTKVNGFAYSSGDVINIPYIESNNVSTKQTIDIWHNRSLNELKINTNFDASGFYGYVTIQYTKSS